MSNNDDDLSSLRAAIDAFAADFASFVDMSHITERSVAHIDRQTIEQLLTRVDEFAQLVTLVHSDAAQSGALLPTLAAHTVALEQTFASVDAATTLVAHAAAQLRLLDERVSRAERDLTAITLDPRNVVSARRRTAAIVHGVGIGARDDDAQLLARPGFLSGHAVFARQTQ
jgi:hypothetical protein